ncbi:hypothetical protein [Microbacterium radiodurans]|uniref:Uncharacterized protein n=1 Tax=Microbacterium radiodurans TaxID=661398 RepID=A0A5J5ITB5_9MICO|nr:hypothetical protein [Microbacterium radiodurans]KAA9089273.1 hypothetical protein F6B42_01945 [Microbacterium radiodurans]
MQNRNDALIFGDREDPRRRLHAIFGGDEPASGQPPENALAWAREVLDPIIRAGGDELRAIRVLREAEPQLTLRSAVFLARHALRGA